MYICIRGGGVEAYEAYIGISDDATYKGIWLGLSDPNDEIRLYHRYSGDVSSCVAVRHSTADKPDAMLVFTLKNDHRIYYEDYSDFKAFIEQTNKQINPKTQTMWEDRTYPIILQNTISVDTIYVVLIEQIDETLEGDTMKMAVWTNKLNTDTQTYVFTGALGGEYPKFKDLPYIRSSKNLSINSTSLKTYHRLPSAGTLGILNWIEPNIVIMIYRKPSYTCGFVIVIPDAHRITYMWYATVGTNVNVYIAAVEKESITNEIYLQFYRSVLTLNDTTYTNNTIGTPAKLGDPMMSGLCLTEDFPTNNAYIDNTYGIVLSGKFNYYPNGRLIVIGYNVYLLDSSFMTSKLILQLQRYDNWITGSVNANDMVYVIRGKEYSLIIPYDPNKVYSSSTIAPYSIPFSLYRHDSYIGDNISIDNTRLRFVASSKGVYYDNTDNNIRYAVIIHGNIKSPDMDSIYRTIDDLYKRIAQLEA